MKKKIMWVAIGQWLVATFVLGTFTLGLIALAAKHYNIPSPDVLWFCCIVFVVYMFCALLFLLFQNKPFTTTSKDTKRKSKRSKY